MTMHEVWDDLLIRLNPRQDDQLCGLIVAHVVETSHIAYTYAYSWFSGVLLAGGWLGPSLCMINGPVPGEDLENNQSRLQHMYL